MPRLLTSHHTRFTQDGLFFYALLGLVALGERIGRFIGEPNSKSDSKLEPAPQPGAEPGQKAAPVLLCFLGLLSVRRRVLAMIGDWAAQGMPPAPREPQRAFSVDLLK
jgi:hypothetical protein